MKIVYSPKFLEHETGMHPERKERLIFIKRKLDQEGFRDYVQAEKIKDKDLLIVHSQQLLDSLKLNSEMEKNQPDNIFNKNTFEIAKLSAGAALTAARIAGKEFAFSLARPPGHHTGTHTFAGFCYLNNIAFAVRMIQKEKNVGKVMIVDFDMHHGNGTQEIFYDDPSVFYLSLHQDPHFTYPGVGFSHENNEHITNIPLPAGTTDEDFLKIFKEKVKECFEKFKPNMLAVSAGFDMFIANGPIVGCMLNIEKSETFFEIGKILKELNVPTFAVLEGGYDLPTLGENIWQFLKTFK
ncbi:MAG: histone deacetylase [Nanoarchaeota archaeon]|nr:histone deacetylase [Nanoarchaeota archaeon]